MIVKLGMENLTKIEDGNTISYHLEGSINRPTIVLVSGSIFNYKQFFPVLLPALKKKLGDKYSYLLYDYVGISNSSELRDEFDFLTIVEQHKQLLDALGIDKAHHFGYSKGSLISHLMATMHPERMISLAGYGNPNLNIADNSIKKVFSRRRQALSSVAGIWHEPVHDRNFDVLYDVVFLPTVFPGKTLKTLSLKDKAKNKIVKKKLKPMLLDTRIDVIDKLYKYYTQDPTPEQLEQYELAMRGITIPTLLMHGTVDEIVPMEASEKLHAWISSSELMKMDNLDHTSPVLQKKPGTQIMANLAEFIKKL